LAWNKNDDKEAANLGGLLKKGGTMADIIIWAVIFVCMAVSMVISFWAGRRFIGFWPKLCFFFISSVVGIVLCPILSGLSVGFAAGQTHLHYLAMRGNTLTAIGGIVAIAWFGTWGLPKMISARKSN
jgi:tryptophan-rich sensory protein